MGKLTRSIKNVIKATPLLYSSVRRLQKFAYRLCGDRLTTQYRYFRRFHRKLDLDNPQTLNEKIQWLKLYDRRDIHTTLADKYAVREWLANHFGEQYLVPLLWSSADWRDIKPDNIPDTPCVIKSNHASGQWYICRDKSAVNWKHLRSLCRVWLNTNYYYASQEWQYKNIPPRIIAEKLLLTHEGRLPNDYKLHFFNGRLGFVYCSLDREGGNFRNMYDPDWQPLYFTWGGHDEKRGPEISPPESFPEMLRIGREIAKLFRYVRVDFYDVDGKLYYGEITLHHGGGFNRFKPESYDRYFGDMLDLSAPVQEDL
ncbi:MAG: hypothetical protein IJS28_06195 [Synergistaceae bacterium]|nr:hypothetical protein [Synergistaceae bacterium]